MIQSLLIQALMVAALLSIVFILMLGSFSSLLPVLFIYYRENMN